MLSTPAQVVAWDAAAAALVRAARLELPGLWFPGGTSDSGLVVDGLLLGADAGDFIGWDLERAVDLAKSPGASCRWQAHPADPRFILMITGGAAGPTVWFFSAFLPDASGSVVPIRHPASRPAPRHPLMPGRPWPSRPAT
jgi:hypothetical protein